MPAPFINKKFTFTNPDGTTIEVVGTGNQYYARFETEDGYTVVKNPETGYYQYAQLSEDKSRLLPVAEKIGEVDPAELKIKKHLRIDKDHAKRMAAGSLLAQGPRSRWRTRRAEKKAATKRQLNASGPLVAPVAAATTGNYVGLCLLIEFPDVANTIGVQEVEDYCNQPGYSGFGNNGSVRDYFFDNSRGRLTYTNVVTQYYTASRNRDYYADSSISFGTRARQLIVEALDDLKAQGFDFNQLSADDSGYIYALNVFYVGGRVNNWAEGLWPHQWSLATPYDVGGGRKFFDYQITNMGSSLTLRTFCHENGHLICDFPDLYDYGGESFGIGNYCLMAYGGNGTNPVQIGAYLKNEAGWADSLTPITPGLNASLDAANNDFYIYSKNENEYFILENRQQTGRDSALPDSGLAIWHVDELASNDNEQMTAAQHYECSLIQADNSFDLENRLNTGDADDLFGAPDKTTFSDATTPDSKWWDGTNSGLNITNISASGSIMTFGTTGWTYGKLVRYISSSAGTKWAHAIIEDIPGWKRIAPTSTDGVSNVVTILKTAVTKNKRVNVLFGLDGNIYGVYMS